MGSLVYRCKLGNLRPSRMNTVPLAHSRFLDVAPSRSEFRIRNDEVVGSIPTSSTKFWLNLFNSFNRAAFGLYNLCTTEQTQESQHLS
jgi:hypothetical protein